MFLSSAFTEQKPNALRRKVREHLYGDEAKLTKTFLAYLDIKKTQRSAMNKQAESWIKAIRELKRSALDIQSLLHAYPLSTEQGRALMCLAEALLRIPDTRTAKLLIQDKMGDADWSRLQETSTANNLVKVAAQGLRLADKMVDESSWTRFLNVATDPAVVQSFRLMMKQMGQEFILGRTIGEAIKRSLKFPKERFSYDMLGEAARTWEMAATYKASYQSAIDEIGRRKDQSQLSMPERDSISVKLSALHPHYRFAKYEEVMDRLLPDLLELCIQAKEAGIALTVDAEEVERLDLSMSILEAIIAAPELEGWEGFGFAVQAYQKRGMAVIEWADDLAKRHSKPLMIRLVKGAYWDTEVKLAQVEGLPDYPVFTRKSATDVSYLACAKRLLEAEGRLYPQFATHNVHTIAAIHQLAGQREDMEFQRLQGMGEDIYSVVNQNGHRPVRVYAPVGNHHDLLAYLVRRLLENGANSSFIHKMYDASAKISDILSDPFQFFEKNAPGRHPNIPLPKDIYGESRQNSTGYDLADPLAIHKIQSETEQGNPPELVKAGVGKCLASHNPANLSESIGEVQQSTPEDLARMLDEAQQSQPPWNALGAEQRATILEQAADQLEVRRGLMTNLLVREAGKVLEDAQNEIREAVDFCRYYANEARRHYGSPETLPGPTGELNQLSLQGRGVFACISPWNFPLAIFTGQVTAALAAGNTVIAKPASQTPLIAAAMIDILYEAGVPKDVLHLLVGPGSSIGSALIEDLRISGIVFTGSTGTAQYMQKALAERGGPIIPFIAETGGLNAMIVDSSALIEQVVDDVVASAFQSAGQRCSALRVMFVQEDIYTPLLHMLSQAVTELQVGDPQWLATDLGPVIDKASRDEIEAYIQERIDQVHVRTPMPDCYQQGAYVLPTLIQVDSMADVTKEIFGPVLHIAKFKAKDLPKVMQDINQAGYGLTFGLQTRIGNTAKKIRDHMRVGNIYINRNIIGAVVGVQPFGGEGLSGTGPKAGGPHYLPQFGVERTWTDNVTASGGNVDLLNLGM